MNPLLARHAEIAKQATPGPWCIMSGLTFPERDAKFVQHFSPDIIQAYIAVAEHAGYIRSEFPDNARLQQLTRPLVVLLALLEERLP